MNRKKELLWSLGFKNIPKPKPGTPKPYIDLLYYRSLIDPFKGTLEHPRPQTPKPQTIRNPNPKTLKPQEFRIRSPGGHGCQGPRCFPCGPAFDAWSKLALRVPSRILLKAPVECLKSSFKGT